MREVQRKCTAACFATDNLRAQMELHKWLQRAERFGTQRRNDKSNRYSLHAPELECIGKGKVRKPCDFGVENAVVVLHKQGLILFAL